MKLFNVAENDNGPVNWESQKPKDNLEAYNWATKQELAARHQKAVFTHKLKPFEHHVVTSYKPEFKVPVLHYIKYHYHYWGVPVGTPNAEKMWKAIQFYVGRFEHARTLEGRYGRLVAKLKKVVRAETFNDLKDKVPEQRIPSSQVPRRIYYTPDKYFNNPYWDKGNVISRYAGTVGHFSEFTPAERNTLVQLDQTLTRNGLDGMDKLYGSTTKIGSKWTNNHFIVVGANGKVIWKHVGGNIVYVDGKKISISYMTDTTEGSFKIQKQILGPLKNT